MIKKILMSTIMLMFSCCTTFATELGVLDFNFGPDVFFQENVRNTVDGKTMTSNTFTSNCDLLRVTYLYDPEDANVHDLPHQALYPTFNQLLSQNKSTIPITFVTKTHEFYTRDKNPHRCLGAFGMYDKDQKGFSQWVIFAHGHMYAITYKKLVGEGSSYINSDPFRVMVNMSTEPQIKCKICN